MPLAAVASSSGGATVRSRGIILWSPDASALQRSHTTHAAKRGVSAVAHAASKKGSADDDWRRDEQQQQQGGAEGGEPSSSQSQSQQHVMWDDASAAPEAGEKQKARAALNSVCSQKLTTNDCPIQLLIAPFQPPLRLPPPPQNAAPPSSASAGSTAGSDSSDAVRFREQAHREHAVHPDQRSEGEYAGGSSAEADWVVDQARTNVFPLHLTIHHSPNQLRVC